MTDIERVIADLKGVQTTEIYPDQVCRLIGALEETKAALWSKMVTSVETSPRDQSGQLLKVKEAAQRLEVSEDWLYHHASKLPFTVRLGSRQLRFSAEGIERYIRRRRA